MGNIYPDKVNIIIFTNPFWQIRTVNLYYRTKKREKTLLVKENLLNFAMSAMT